MHPTPCVAFLCLGLIVICSCNVSSAQEPASPVKQPHEKTPSSPITVTKSSISFDPRTCFAGSAQLNWFFGFSRVEMLGHQGNECVFKYIADVEMGEAHYLVRVPLDSGLVTINNDPNRPKMGIVTSFDLKNAKRLKHGNSGLRIWSVQIGDTGEEVSYRITDMPKSEMLPRAGDKVRMRVTFYEDTQQKKLCVPGVSQTPYEFVVGSGTYPLLDAAMDELTVGDTRQFSFPRKARGNLKTDLSDDKFGEKLYAEIQLVWLEAAKK